MSLPQLKQRLVANGKQNSFFAYADTVVSELIEAGRVGTATSYRAIVNILRQFRADRDLSFEELNLDLLQRFERWHLSRGNGYGGLAVYMKSVRAIYNKAIKAGLAEKAGYPFDDYVIRSGKPRKRAIPADAISRIRTLSLKDGTTLSRDRDIFLLCFYLRGMPYVDLAHLRLSNIIDGRIQYNRQKTNEPFTVKIPDQAWPILDKFIQGKQPGEYLLPVIKDRKLAMAQYKAVANARIRYNRNLKKLAALAGIDETLTSYVARHSYASIANDMEVPIAAISEMLGHQKISTTQAYLNALHKSRLDDYQDKVLSAL